MLRVSKRLKRKRNSYSRFDIGFLKTNEIKLWSGVTSLFDVRRSMLDVHLSKKRSVYGVLYPADKKVAYKMPPYIKRSCHNLLSFYLMTMSAMHQENDNTVATPAFHLPGMSDSEFRRFSEFVYDKCGIKLPPAKKHMLTARLSKRLRALGILTFKEYYKYILNPKVDPDELTRMIDVVTTNKTEFFRESAHFDFLKNQALPALIRSGRISARRKLYVWSAGCSTGEEPYTLAMVLAEFFSRNNSGDFSILATDISTRVLETAKRAVYDENVIKPVLPLLKRKYLMHGKGSQAGFFRVVPELRGFITFRRLNFMDADFKIRTPVDILFCRNVVIYFDKQTQAELFRKFYSILTPGGYLFIGNSETLQGINERFVGVAATVYRKPE